jgi:hypothetical protein
VLSKLPAVLISVAVLPVFAQQAPKPQIKVNMINVCSPSADEQKEISSALAQIPRRPVFGPDFEIDRGRSTLEGTPDFVQAATGTQVAPGTSTAAWVRIRREFPAQHAFSTVQYSFSKDPQNMVETLVFRVRDPKDLMLISIEDNASAVTTPLAMLSTSTPVSRIRLERMGKSSVVLARCPATQAGPAPDQSAYEPLFQSATSIIASYRSSLAAARTVPDELARIAALDRRPKAGASPTKKSVVPKPPAKKH